MNATAFVIPVPPQAAIPVAGERKSFPVRRIWCVGRNYLEHIREMGNDERDPPFFFAKHADMLEKDGATIPYPPLTKDLHHEVELSSATRSASTSRGATCSRPRARKNGRGRSASRSTIPRPARRCSRRRSSATPRRARSGCRSTAPSGKRETSRN